MPTLVDANNVDTMYVYYIDFSSESLTTFALTP